MAGYYIGAANSSAERTMQDACRILSGLSASNMQIAMDFIKNLAQADALKSGRTDITEKEQALAELLELRREFTATNPRSFAEERAAAMAEKYGFAAKSEVALM